MSQNEPPDIQEHLDALKAFAENSAGSDRENPELRVKKGQLKVIRKTIRQLEKSGVAVPVGLTREQDDFEAAIKKLEGSAGTPTAVYEQILEITERLGRICRRRPYRDLYARSQEWRSKATPPDVLRQAVLDALNELGGSAHQDEVLDLVGQNLKDRLTEADLDRGRGKFNRWQQSARKEARKLLKKGAMNKERGGRWLLAK